METRVLIQSGPKPYHAAFPPPQWCYRWNLTSIDFLVSGIFMFESVNRRMLKSHHLSSPGAFEERSCFKSLRCCIYHTINAKMPTIVGILTLMSRINFMLSWVEHGIFFITSGPDLSFFENTEEPDQIASDKASDQDRHCFPVWLKRHACNWDAAG